MTTTLTTLTTIDTPADGARPLADRVARAMERAQQAFLKTQRADGAWRGLNLAGPFGTAWTLVFERYLAALSDEDAREGVRYLRAHQLPSGAAQAWPAATEGTLEGTCIWYSGMLSAGVAATDPDMVRARQYIDKQGGFQATTRLGRIILATAGALEPSTLPWIPLAFKLVPGETWLASRVFGVDTMMAINLLPALIRGLKADGVAPNPLLHPLKALENRRVIAYLSARQDPSGGWIGVAFETLLCAATLVSLGVPRSDPRITRALVYVREAKHAMPEGLYVSPFHCDIWDTAQVIRGLLSSGLSADHPAIGRAVDYVLSQQTTVPPPPDFQTAPRGTPTTGAWPFEPNNILNPDIDSTQEALGALAAVAARRTTPDARLNAAIEKAHAWLLAMQNWDGGFAAFTLGKPRQDPGVMFYHLPKPPRGPGWLGALTGPIAKYAERLIEVGDPSTSDVTARALWTLAQLGHTRDDPRVQAAIALMKYQRFAGNDVWWGMWSVNFLTATSYVLTGVMEIGESPAADYVRTAVRWMLSKQNADGGWGESVDSYRDPALAGCGPSTRTVTAYAVWALVATGEARTPAVERGVRYLLDHQGEDGFWPDTAPLGVLIPNWGYYYNTTFATYFALEALGAYHAKTRA